VILFRLVRVFAILATLEYAAATLAWGPVWLVGLACCIALYFVVRRFEADARRGATR
jgi:hypothetical protein